ncbi:MAG: c-type cytochrome, partial [bacterium]|nr:c-type cytochrome [bacterium]
EMPAIFFEGRQMWQIVAFVRSLSEGADSGQLPGDPRRGARIFRDKGGCAQCHMVGGEGGRSGPSLDDIGAFRSAEHLTAAILDPDDQVLPVHWVARVVTSAGQTISGRRLNEDSYSIQVLDSKDCLVSLDRSKVQSYDVSRKSTMPSYRGVLGDSEVEDVVAYLANLRLRRAQ